jgi:hypothetical protein
MFKGNLICSLASRSDFVEHLLIRCNHSTLIDEMGSLFVTVGDKNDPHGSSIGNKKGNILAKLISFFPVTINNSLYISGDLLIFHIANVTSLLPGVTKRGNKSHLTNHLK